MHYLDEGRGDPVVMVHGNPTWSFFYRRLVLGLRGGFRCVVPDHIGCGLSDKGADFSYRLEDHVANLEQLVVDLDLRGVTLVVHDWGGAIGMGAALRQAERIKRLVIFNTAAFPAPHLPKRIACCRWPFVGPLAVRGGNLFARAALRMAMGDPRKMTLNTARGFLYPYNSWAHRVAIQKFVEDIPMEPEHPSYDLLKKIGENLPALADRPVLLAWGMKDFCFTPWFLDRWREIYPHAEVHRYEGAGHYLLEDEGDAILREVRSFLHRPRVVDAAETKAVG